MGNEGRYHLFRKQCRYKPVKMDFLFNGMPVFVEQEVNVYSIL